MPVWPACDPRRDPAVDLADTEQDAQFRLEVRGWLQDRLSDELRALGADLSTDAELRLAWERELGRGAI